MARPVLGHRAHIGSTATHGSITAPQPHWHHAQLSGMQIAHLPGCLLGRCALPGCLKSLLGTLQTLCERPGLCLQPNQCNEASS